MDYPRCVTETIKIIRGNRSQLQLSRRLGYSFNKLYRLESGRASVTWAEFHEITKKCGLDLAARCGEFLGYHQDPADAVGLFGHLVGRERATTLAEAFSVKRSTIYHWRSGRATIPAAAVFRAINIYHFNLASFVASFADVSKIPSLRKRHQSIALERDLYYRFPHAAAVVRALELNGYLIQKHSDAFIVQATGLSLAEVEDSLSLLGQAGLIEKKDRRYVPVNRRVGTVGNFRKHNTVKAFWIERALRIVEKLKKPPPDGVLGYKLLVCSDDALEEIRQKYLEFYSAVTKIVDDDEDPQNLRLLQVQMLDLSVLHGDL